MTRVDLLKRLADADIAFAEVNTMADLAVHPHLRRIEVDTPNGKVSYAAPAAIFVGEPRHYGAVPGIGDHVELPKLLAARTRRHDRTAKNSTSIICAQWIGRSTEASDIVTAQLVKGLRATLFQDIGEPKTGDAAPWTTHWCLAQPVFPMSELGPDGHPTRGGFLPPVPLPRRMWAGGEIEFLEPLRVGDEATRTLADSRRDDEDRLAPACCASSPSSTPITTPRGTAIRERQDIVYRDIGGAAPAAPAKAASAAARRKTSREPCRPIPCCCSAIRR